jgi:hypothetical protein
VQLVLGALEDAGLALLEGHAQPPLGAHLFGPGVRRAKGSGGVKTMAKSVGDRQITPL